VKGFELTKKIGLAVLLAGALMVPGRPLRAQEASAQPVAAQQASSTGTAETSADAEVDETREYKQSKMVASIGGMLGMKPSVAAVVFEWLNFAVLALLLVWAVMKSVPKMFRDRSSAIQKELTDARSATEEASVRLNSVEERLAKLDGQIAEMKANAEKDAAVEEQRLKASAEDEKNKILATAEQEIASLTQAAQRQLQQFAAGLAIEQAAKRLVISAETDRLLVQNFAQRLGAGSADGGKGGEN
jgi:F-type H+-transporting ATPase subunit b